MDAKKYQQLFKEITKTRYGVDINFQKIEEGLSHVRNGGALEYEDLELIADEKLWPFKRFWMWPSREQIENDLGKTEGKLINPFSSGDHEAREKEILSLLLGIFKNLALVSIILRFVWPEYYAIYSRPNLWILRTERGASDIEEYKNYIKVMRILKETFRVERTADVDMIIYAISKKCEEHKEFIKFLADHLPGSLKIREVISYLSNDPLNVAEIFYQQNDYKTAGFWASQAFEILLYREYKRVVKIPRRNKDKGELEDIIDQLCEYEEYYGRGDFLHELRRLRNRAIHPDKPFNKEDAKKLIDGVRRFMTEMLEGRTII